MEKWQAKLELNSKYGAHNIPSEIVYTDTDSVKTKCKYYKQGLCYGQKGAPAVDCYGDKFECNVDDSWELQNSPLYLFKKKLRIELKKRIKDYAKIYYIDNVLLIEFYHVGALSITYIETNITDKIESGLSTTALAEKIEKWYTSIILSRYFVNRN